MLVLMLVLMLMLMLMLKWGVPGSDQPKGKEGRSLESPSGGPAAFAALRRPRSLPISVIAPV